MAEPHALYAFESTTSGDPKTKTFASIRDVTDEEFAASQAAESLLRTMTIGSPLAELQEAGEDLGAEIIAVEEGGATTSTAHLVGARIQRAFKGYLSAFKSFDDRTSVWLSREVGKDDPAYVEFKRLLSHEFDSNFAYRLCCGLRNAAEHAGDVINRMSLSSREEKPHGAVAHDARIWLDGPNLAQTFPKMRAATRKELESVSEPLDVGWIVGGVALSCQRAHAGLFDAMWDRIELAVQVIESFHREALDVGGEWAMFVPKSSMETLGKRPKGQIQFRWNSWNLAHLARLNRQECDAILSAPTAPLHWQDFAVEE